MEVSTSLPDDWYWEFRKKAAANQNTEEEQLRELVADYIGENFDEEEFEEISADFEKFAREFFRLERGKIKTKNVVSVASKMRHGMNWNKAVEQVAEQAQRERSVGNEYDKTIRSQCTRELGIDSTQDFKYKVDKLIDEFEEEN